MISAVLPLSKVGERLNHRLNDGQLRAWGWTLRHTLEPMTLKGAARVCAPSSARRCAP